VGRAAELARWPLPRTLAVLALDGDSAGSVTRGLDLDALVGTDAHGSWLVVPDPSGPGRRASLQRTIHRAGVAAALGPAVAPRDAHRSLRWARLALELVGRRLIPDERPTVVTEHLPSLVVLQQLELARALVDDELGPLAGLPDGERRRLLSTLEAWLAHQRHTPSVAAALHVHPQTVRYRVGRLRELLGDRLDTPDGRFGLELALRAQRAVAPAP
jgi:sugar diacid utilization regulator